MINYDELRMNEKTRYQYNIKAYRILDIKGSQLFVQRDHRSDKRAVCKVANASSRFEIGDYIDLIIIMYDNYCSSVKFIGKTPEEFIPVDGQNIGD